MAQSHCHPAFSCHALALIITRSQRSRPHRLVVDKFREVNARNERESLFGVLWECAACRQCRPTVCGSLSLIIKLGGKPRPAIMIVKCALLLITN